MYPVKSSHGLVGSVLFGREIVVPTSIQPFVVNVQEASYVLSINSISLEYMLTIICF